MDLTFITKEVGKELKNGFEQLFLCKNFLIEHFRKAKNYHRDGFEIISERIFLELIEVSLKFF
ncbi:MAG: hypothetical protein QXP52_01495 [Candidatus Aenigmatarchaeota archaeon]